MGKRVKKNRAPSKGKKAVAAQSPKATPQENNASVENIDDRDVVVEERKPCPHLDKGVDIDKLLTKLKSSEPISCEYCRDGGRGNKGKGKTAKKKGSALVDSKSDSKGIWVCLECGHYVCGGGLPTAPNSHAVFHVRRKQHRLLIKWDNPQLRWCFNCSTFIPVEKTEENGENKDPLFEVVKLIKECSSQPSTADVEDVWFGSGSVTSAIRSEGGTLSDILDGKSGYMVRGLVNLGNTCFFNSVMQNLLALDRLRDYFLNLDLSMGQLTVSLKKLYAETKPDMGLKNAINPKPFFGSICAKAPQFKGYQQHDSHELLRCLLDGLYMEELALRKHSNASKNDVVSTNQNPTFVDAVFGGQISSTLCCVECGHSSTVYEPFLDLSLSVPTKKTPSKKAQPVSRAKKTKLPPKKLGRARGKVNKDADQQPAQGAMAPLPSSESPGLGHVAVPQTETMVASSGDSSLSGAVSSSAEASELCSASQNLLAVAESENGQVMDKTVKENAAGGDGFSWMDYLGTENTENTVGADDSTCMDYCEPGAIADENDLISQNNDISLFQDSEDKDMVLNEDLAESSEVSLLEGESNQEPHGSSGNLQEEELPLLVQDSQVLLLPYKEESTRNEESVRENEASSSNVGHGQEEVEFDGFGDMFNEPEVVVGPGIGPSLANDVAETGFLAGSISDSDPNEVDDSDSPVSVESCLAHFIKLELLTDDNAWDCENCAKILQRQKLEAKKKQAKKSKNLTNGGETQSQCELPSLVKELPYPNGVEMISNGDISSSGESLVLHNEITDSLKQNSVKVGNCQTGELCNEGKSEIEEASLMKSNSSVSSKFHGQEEESGRIQPVDSSNAENHSGYDIPQQSNSQMSENHQSGESEDEEIDSENVKVKRNATKRYLINKAPPILTIHLKRFSQDARGRLSKLNGHVNFRETIDLRPYVDTRCEDRDNCIYHLAGVVEHSGTMRGGHYIAYVKGGEKRKGKAETENISSSWYYVSDHYVRQVSLEEVLRCEAYILFYERS